MRKYLHVSCVDKSLGPHQLHSNHGWCKISQPEQSIYFALVYFYSFVGKNLRND